MKHLAEEIQASVFNTKTHKYIYYEFILKNKTHS